MLRSSARACAIYQNPSFNFPTKSRIILSKFTAGQSESEKKVAELAGSTLASSSQKNVNSPRRNRIVVRVTPSIPEHNFEPSQSLENHSHDYSKKEHNQPRFTTNDQEISLPPPKESVSTLANTSGPELSNNEAFIPPPPPLSKSDKSIKTAPSLSPQETLRISEKDIVDHSVSSPKLQSTQTIILTDNESSETLIKESIEASSNLNLDIKRCQVIPINERDPWDIPFPEDLDNKVEVILLTGNPGRDKSRREQWFKLIHYFMSKQCALSAKIPYKEKPDEGFELDEIPTLRKNWRSNISSMIRNRLMITNESEALMEEDFTADDFLAACQELHNRKLGKGELTPLQRVEEPILKRVKTAVNIYRDAFSLSQPDILKQIEKNRALKSVFDYLINTRGLAYPFPPNLRYALLPHPDFPKGRRYPTLIAPYNHDGKFNSNRWFNQGLLNVIHKYRSMVDFLFRIKRKELVVKSDTQINGKRIFRFHEYASNLVIEFDSNQRIKSIRFGSTRIHHPNSDILVTNMTKIERTFLNFEGGKIIKIKDESVRSKCMKGGDKGYYLAHFEKNGSIAEIHEGKEEALTGKMVHTSERAKRESLSILAIPRTHLGSVKNLPSKVYKLRIACDNDGIRPDQAKSLWTSLAPLKEKYQVELIMARSPIPGIKNDFNAILTASGLSDVRDSYTRRVRMTKRIFQYPTKPLQIPLEYQEVLDKIRDNPKENKHQFEAARLALALDEVEEAKNHVEHAIVNTTEVHEYILALCMRADCFIIEKNFDEALKILEYARSIRETLPTNLERRILETIGDTLHQQSMDEDAIWHYESALELPLFDPRDKANLLRKIGRVSKDTLYYESSFKIRRDLVKAEEKLTCPDKDILPPHRIKDKLPPLIPQSILFYYIQNRLDLLLSYAEYAELFTEKNAPGSAMKLYERAIKMINKIFKTPHRPEIAKIYFRMGKLCLETDPVNSLNYFIECLKINHFLEDRQVELEGLSQIISIIRKIYRGKEEEQWHQVCEKLGLKTEVRKQYLEMLKGSA